MGWLQEHDTTSPEEREADRQVRFEATLTKRIMAHAAGWSARQTVDAAKDQGYGAPILAWLREHTMFPVRLGASKIQWMQRVTVGQLFGSHFNKTPFFKEYAKFVTDNGLDDREDKVGLCFNWPGVQGGGIAMVLHNYPVASSAIDPDLRIERGTRIVRPFGSPVVVHVVETFKDFLTTTGTEWYVD